MVVISSSNDSLETSDPVGSELEKIGPAKVLFTDTDPKGNGVRVSRTSRRHSNDRVRNDNGAIIIIIVKRVSGVQSRSHRRAGCEICKIAALAEPTSTVRFDG